MGRIVKLIGSGIGLASEAIHHARSKSKSGRSPSPSPNQGSSSDPVRSIPDAPPEYVEADEAVARELIRTGQAEDVPNYPSEKKNRSAYLSPDQPPKSKAAEAGYGDEDDDDSSSESGDEELGADEAAWELDDMAERIAPPSYEASEASEMPLAADSEEVKGKKEDMMVRRLVQMAGNPPYPAPKLPCPVIIPQKRPRNKDRGFVRAYAPVLQESGVSQEVFLKFLTDWHTASKASPWIDVVFVAAGIVGFVPELTAQIVGTVVQVVAGTARELQSRQRRNTFLDRVNEDLFMPRGLYAMVMAFKDEVPGQQSGGPLSRLAGTLGQSLFKAERLDINQTAAKFSNPDPNMSKLKKNLKDIRLTSGKTYGEIELPQAAALVYPELDRAVESDLRQAEGKGKAPAQPGMMDKWKSAGEFVQDYFDRKAQASYEAQHQGSALAVPSASRAPFMSRFSDPNHPANSGSLISLLTGGAVNPAARRQEKRARKQERRALKREYKDARRVARGRMPRGPRRVRPPKGQRKGIIKKIMQQDVLYLIIVNLPTQEEVQQSVSKLEQTMASGGFRAPMA